MEKMCFALIVLLKIARKDKQYEIIPIFIESLEKLIEYNDNNKVVKDVLALTPIQSDYQ